MNYVIIDFELGKKKTVVKAPGVAEAMFEYLPWPTLEIKISSNFTHGIAEVIDLKTEFRYEVVTQI